MDLRRQYCVYCGGSWDYHTKFALLTFRYAFGPTYSDRYQGLRFFRRGACTTTRIA